MAAVLAVAGKLSTFLLEAAFYCLLWRVFGRRLPFWRFFCVVVSASTTDLLAGSIANQVAEAPHLAARLAPLAGLRLAGEGFLPGGALRVAFGTLGLLTALRIGLTAFAQARALNVRFTGALAVIGSVWLLTRIAILWSVDLMKGASPLMGR